MHTHRTTCQDAQHVIHIQKIRRTNLAALSHGASIKIVDGLETNQGVP